MTIADAVLLAEPSGDLLVSGRYGGSDLFDVSAAAPFVRPAAETGRPEVGHVQATLERHCILSLSKRPLRPLSWTSGQAAGLALSE